MSVTDTPLSHLKDKVMLSTNEVIKKILSKLSKEERSVLVNHIMQEKADMDFKEGNSKMAFTPMYQVNEYLLKLGLIQLVTPDK